MGTGYTVSEKMELWHIIDMSGSMQESGRPFAVRECLRTIAQLVRQSGQSMKLKYLLAGEHLQELETDLTMDYPEELLHPSGTFDVSQLMAKLEAVNGCFLFLTDGSWNAKTLKILRGWCERQPSGKVKVIQFVSGSTQLREISMVYSPEEVLEALDSWLVRDVED